MRKFTRDDENGPGPQPAPSGADTAPDKSMCLYETPKTADELISLLEKLQKDVQATDFFKRIFEQDPIASENKFLNETVQSMQARLQDSETRCD